MKPEEVSTIKGLRASLGQLVISIEPVNNDEWAAMDKLMSAFKSLRAIDCSKLGQISMPFGSEPEIVCPTCHGEGTVKTDGGLRETTCPACNGRTKIPASKAQRTMFIEGGALAASPPAGGDNNNGVSELGELNEEDAALFAGSDGEGEPEPEEPEKEPEKAKRGRPRKSRTA